ncbi:MAG: flippase-like domain-containing protein [Muribaculaceae bacterium]|nr:flippase-like domain-containing protein [Muribaculaceae bacterium]
MRSSLNRYSGYLLRVLLPLAIGGTVFWLLFRNDFTADTWRTVSWTSDAIVAVGMAWLCMIGRDFGLSWRFKTLADGDLSWKDAIRVDMMCEFTSAVTPTAVGGSAMGMVYLNHEGIDIGRAATLTMTTLFLDELFFVLVCPLICILMPEGALFGFSHDGFAEGIRIAFWLVYAGLVAWTFLLFVGIFVRPHAVRRFFLWLTGIGRLRRWHDAADRMTSNIIATSQSLKGRHVLWWIKVFAATAISWCSRFLVVNALVAGFVPEAPQLTVFCRQFVIWVVLIVSPTPGGSGLSEWLFTQYYSDIIGSVGVALVLALLWRIVSYYIYLLIGLLILPSFLTPRKKSKNKLQ